VNASTRRAARHVCVLGVALCCSVFLSCRGRPAPEEESAGEAENLIPVGAQAVEVGNIRAVIHATGIVTPAQGAEFLVVAPGPARIAEVTRAEGEPVASGDILVRFDIPSASEEAARQRAEVARAQAQLESARVAQSRSRDLLERGIISRREMEDADREFASAQNDVARAERARDAADAAVARSTIRAPFNGIVAKRLHNPGDLVNGTATDPVLRIVDSRRLELTVTIPAADTSRVLPGTTARVAAAPGVEPVRLSVASRSPSANGADTVLRLTFAEPTPLAVDTPVEVDIDAEERTNVPLIPADSFVGEGPTRAVMVAVGNRAERRVVTTGIADEERVEITSGLKPGELLITRGQNGLQDGAAISVDTRQP
jgi:RND family efflux transporter MFP subunit